MNRFLFLGIFVYLILISCPSCLVWSGLILAILYYYYDGL